MRVCTELSHSKALVVIVLSLMLCVGAEAPLQKGKLLSIEKVVQSTPQVWLWNTPVAFNDVVTYRLRVESDARIYEVDYTPLIQPDGVVPGEWNPQSAVQFRVDKPKIVFRLASGNEVEAILRKVRVPTKAN